MRRKTVCVLVVCLALGLVGCETLPRKFIRKKKQPKYTPSQVYLDEGEHQKQFSNEYYYKTHFTLWKTWHDDMAANLTGNSKKLKRSSEEAYSHLEQMNDYLKPEFQEKLKPLLADLGGYRQKFDQASYSKADANSMRSELDKLKRLVSNDFYYEKVKDGLLPDEVDLGDAGSA